MTYIDPETTIYNLVKDACITVDSKIDSELRVLSKPPTTTAKYPFVLVYMIDSHEPSDLRDSSQEQKFADVIFQVDVYSVKGGGKTECKKFMKVIDPVFRQLNFRKQAQVVSFEGTKGEMTHYTTTYRGLSDGDTFYSV